jgi:hypothetical protein
VYLDAELATDLAQKVMERMGEESIDISLHAGAQHHEGGKDGVRLRTYNFTLIDVCHELAHVVHERNAKQEPKNWHDYVAWNLVALITCVMCDVLDGKRK